MDRRHALALPLLFLSGPAFAKELGLPPSASITYDGVVTLMSDKEVANMTPNESQDQSQRQHSITLQHMHGRASCQENEKQTQIAKDWISQPQLPWHVRAKRARKPAHARHHARQRPQPGGRPHPLQPTKGSQAHKVSTLRSIKGDTAMAASTQSSNPNKVYSLNQRVQAQSRVPDGFPGFVRNGFDVRVVGPGYRATPSSLLYLDIKEGEGELPVDGQEVVFQYSGYNESGAVIDSSYRQGRPAQARLGTAGLIPGFEEGIRGMRAGGLRRFIVPPALGPPVGPSTFFSAKQCEVFDVQLLSIRNCERRQMAMFSDVVCE